MSVDQIEYEIVGGDLQAVIVTLDPGEAMVAEAGAMMFMEQGIAMATQLTMQEAGHSVLKKVLGAGRRVLAGESFFITVFANEGEQRSRVAFASPYPGHVVPIDLGKHNGHILCQKYAFLCGARGVNVDIAVDRKLGTGLFGGEGFVLQRLTYEPLPNDTKGNNPDPNCLVFCHAGGTVVKKELAQGEVLHVDTGCLVAFEQSVSYEVEIIKGVRNKLFGGEGFFLLRMTGPGTVWMQSMPFGRLAGRVLASAVGMPGTPKGEGSLLSGVWRATDRK